MKDDQRVALTKRLLKEGLLRLLKTNELDNVNVTELCSESGINRATFYRHYEQPRDILNELRREMSQNVKKIAKRRENENSIRESLEDICNYFNENAELLEVFFKTRTDDDFVALLNEIYTEQFAEIRHRGFANEIDDDSLRLGAYYFAGGIYYILRQWILEPINKSPKEVAELIFNLVGSVIEAKHM